MDEIVDRLPFPVVGLDTGGESINHTLINRARRPRHLLHRLPALKVQRQKSRRAEVRRRRPPARLRLPLRHGSRAETPRHPLRPRPAEPLHRHHKNKRLALQQTRQEDPHQRQATDRYQRLIDSGILTGAKAAELAHLMAITNPAGLICRITTIQTQLIALAPAKTSVLEASPTGLFTKRWAPSLQSISMTTPHSKINHRPAAGAISQVGAVRQYFRLRARDPFACADVCRPIGGHRTWRLLSHCPRAGRNG